MDRVRNHLKPSLCLSLLRYLTSTSTSSHSKTTSLSSDTRTHTTFPTMVGGGGLMHSDNIWVPFVAGKHPTFEATHTPSEIPH